MTVPVLIPALQGGPVEPRLLAPVVPLTVVYGGGGPFGIAWGLGIARAFTNAGFALQDAPSMGTSAGAWVAACVAHDVSFDKLRDLGAVRVPNLRPGLLHGIAAEVFGDAFAPTVTAMVARVPNGARVMLSGARWPIADLVAASSAVPWLFAPHHIGKSLYIDGGCRSMLSADLAPRAQRMLVIAPFAGPVLGAAGRGLEHLAQGEMRAWANRTGGKPVFVRPNRVVAALVRHPLDLFDRARAVAAYDLAFEHATDLLRGVDKTEFADYGTALSAALPALLPALLPVVLPR